MSHVDDLQAALTEDGFAFSRSPRWPVEAGGGQTDDLVEVVRA